MQVPDTRYARSGDLRIAYQTWGDGPPVLYIADLISHVDIVLLALSGRDAAGVDRVDRPTEVITQSLSAQGLVGDHQYQSHRSK